MSGHHAWPPSMYQPDFQTLAEYPRAEVIMDEEALMHIAATERLFERYKDIQTMLQSLRDEIAVIKTDLDGHKVRLFQRLRTAHPTVTDGYGYGWRRLFETLYIVGWDVPPKGEA